jgi:hypothetical protein
LIVDQYQQQRLYARDKSSSESNKLMAPVLEETKADHVQDDDRSPDDQSPQDDDDPRRFRQYLVDRATGRSKVSRGKRPPCFACYVPMPVVWFADYIEQNAVFECLGGVGCFKHDNLIARQFLLGSGLILNILGTLLSLYTVFSVSTNSSVLWFSSLTRGAVAREYQNFSDTNSTREYYDVRIGARAVAIELETGGRTVELFEDFCDRGNDFWTVPLGECDACDEVSGRIIVTLFVSLFMSIPSLTTDALRLYHGYDCNCQKVFASFAAIISVGFAFYSILLYQLQCFASFSYGVLCQYDNGTVIEGQSLGACPEFTTEIRHNFFFGPAWIAMLVGGCMKAVDMLLNFAIPTPTICRDRAEQREYELLHRREEEEVVKPDTNGDGDVFLFNSEVE